MRWLNIKPKRHARTAGGLTPEPTLGRLHTASQRRDVSSRRRRSRRDCVTAHNPRGGAVTSRSSEEILFSFIMVLIPEHVAANAGRASTFSPGFTAKCWRWCFQSSFWGRFFLCVFVPKRNFFGYGIECLLFYFKKWNATEDEIFFYPSVNHVHLQRRCTLTCGEAVASHSESRGASWRSTRCDVTLPEYHQLYFPSWSRCRLY